MASDQRYSYEYEPSKLKGLKNRLLQLAARFVPGGATFRVRMHRARGVKIGDNVWIGYDAIIDTSKPWTVTIEDGAHIGIRAIIIGHFSDTAGVKIGRWAFIGPGVIIMPNVEIGEGAVVSAGSVVTRSVPPFTVVQGNPAVPVAKTDVPMGFLSVKAFARQLKPISAGPARATTPDPRPAGSTGSP